MTNLCWSDLEDEHVKSCFDIVEVELHFERRTSFYTLNLVLPFLLITALCSCGILLPCESCEQIALRNSLIYNASKLKFLEIVDPLLFDFRDKITYTLLYWKLLACYLIIWLHFRIQTPEEFVLSTFHFFNLKFLKIFSENWHFYNVL